MDKYDFYFQMAAIIWVVGGSLIGFKKADWIVQQNAKMGWKVDRSLVRQFSLFTMTLGVIGGLALAVKTALDIFKR